MELFTDPGRIREDARILETGIKNGWLISEETRRRVIERLAKLVDVTDLPARDQIAAARALIQADAINARREATAASEKRLPAPRYTQINIASLPIEQLRALDAAIGSASEDEPGGTPGDPPGGEPGALPEKPR